MTTEIAPDLAGTALGRALEAPERVLAAPGTSFLKDHRRTAVAVAALEGRDVFIKRFKPYAWYRRLEWLVTPSPARRCWQSSHDLQRAGFRVATPLAVAERRRAGLPADSYFMASGVDGAAPAGWLWLETISSRPARERRAVLEALARELRRFHDAGFYTRDANANNLLVRLPASGEPEFFYLDLENVRHLGEVSRRRRVKNLVQLYRPVRGAIGLSDRLRFVAAYAGRRIAELGDWIAELDRLDRAKEAEYRARRGR